MAGYMDADGCVLFNTGIRVEITGCYKHILDWFQDSFGGKVALRQREDRRDIYRWHVTGKNAARCLELLMPHLREKQSQAKLALAMRELPPGPEREGLHAQMKGLKHIHY